jgi:hypothetical protein
MDEHYVEWQKKMNAATRERLRSIEAELAPAEAVVEAVADTPKKVNRPP